MNCKMRDCDSFDCNLGLGGACNILVGNCDYTFVVGSVYNFEFRLNLAYLDGQYEFLGDLEKGRIALRDVPSRIEFRFDRKDILSVDLSAATTNKRQKKDDIL